MSIPPKSAYPSWTAFADLIDSIMEFLLSALAPVDFVIPSFNYVIKEIGYKQRKTN